MEWESQTAAEPPVNSWINFKLLASSITSLIILSFHMENQQWVTENKAIHTGLVSFSGSSIPLECSNPINRKGCLSKVFLPHQEVRSSSNVFFNSLQEGRHFTTNRSRWPCWQSTLHSPTGQGCSLQPPLSSLNSLAWLRICWALKRLPEEKLFQLIQFIVS